MLQSIDALQSLLSPNEKYAVGDEVTLADITVFPFFLRTEISLGGDHGAYDEGCGKKVWEMLMTDEKYALFRNYYGALKARDTFKSSYDEVRSSRPDSLSSADSHSCPSVPVAIPQRHLRNQIPRAQREQESW